MESLSVAIQRVNQGLAPDPVELPEYKTPDAAGMDLQAAVREPVVIPSGQYRLIPTGLSFALPTGYEAQVRSRSGLALKHGLAVLNAPGTIDADYRGEVSVILINHGPEPFQVERHMRIAQLVIARYSRVYWQEAESLAESQRGSGGYGSTGV
jgi:dUTP pyrophosphatase